MSLDGATTAFRDWLTGEYRADANYENIEVLEGDAAPGGGLSVRLHVGKRSYYEVRVDLAAEAGAELQVGFSTESRVVNEEIEEDILSSGGDLNEMLADELCDLGEEPLPMSHFFERPAFRFTTRLPLPGTDALADPVLQKRVKATLQSCRILFQEAVDEA